MTGKINQAHCCICSHHGYRIPIWFSDIYIFSFANQQVKDVLGKLKRVDEKLTNADKATLDKVNKNLINTNQATLDKLEKLEKKLTSAEKNIAMIDKGIIVKF